MENELYKRTIAVVAAFIGEDKAKKAVARQVQKANATPDSLTAGDLKGIVEYLIGATTLYLHPDKTRQDQLAARLKELAG